MAKFGQLLFPEFSGLGELRQFEPQTNETAIFVKFMPFPVAFRSIFSVVLG